MTPNPTDEQDRTYSCEAPMSVPLMEEEVARITVDVWNRFMAEIDAFLIDQLFGENP